MDHWSSDLEWSVSQPTPRRFRFERFLIGIAIRVTTEAAGGGGVVPNSFAGGVAQKSPGSATIEREAFRLHIAEPQETPAHALALA